MDTKPAATSRLLESAAHGVIVIGDAIEDCNDAACRILELPRSALIARSLVELSPRIQADGTLSSERWARRIHAAKAGLPQWFQWQFRRDSADAFQALVHLGPASRESGPAVIAQVHDLSRLAGAGWVHEESEARLRNVLEHTKPIIFVKDRDGRYSFVNHELERLVRRPAHEIIGRTDHELWRTELAERFRRNDLQVLEQRKAIEFQESDAFGGQQRTFLSFKFPLFDMDGAPYAVCGIATDISERKQLEDALRGAALAVSSAQGATVFQELVRYLATTLKLDCALIAAPCEGAAGNMRVLAFYLDGEIRENFEYPVAGTPCETVVGQAFRIYPSRLRAAFPEDSDFAELGFESYAGYPLNDTNGKPLGLIAAISRRPMAEADFIESVLKIFAMRAAAELERMRSEEALRGSEEHYRAIFNASADGLLLRDAEFRVVDVNPAFLAITGHSREEVLGARHVLTMPVPEIERARELQRRALSGETVHIEGRGVRKDGTHYDCEVALAPMLYRGQPHVLGTVRDISARRQAEARREQLEAQLRQAQKMEALGQLTGGIAHDFNNLLTSIMGYIVLATEREAGHGDPKLAKYLEQAHLSCVRARDLIQQMLTFSRGQRGEPRPLSLAPCVKESVKLLRSSLPATVEIETDLAREVPAVLLDPVQLDQILLNLCINARDAMGGIGEIRVAVQRLHADDLICASCRQIVAGTFVELCVADSGPGIASEVLERMFEPFFTTKEVGKGSGMGLATVHGIVHEHSGHVVVDNVPGRGARFRIVFPPLQADKTGAVTTTASREGSVPPRHALHGRVLVVDDEETVAEFMRDLLESWGVEVTSASTASEARERVARDPQAYDVVITDQTMPRMTGLELARELLAIRRDLPVILYTGYGEGIAQEKTAAAGICALLKKPVEPQVLFALLKAHLLSPRPSPTEKAAGADG